LGPDADWTAALSGADAVVHLAGRAHVDRGGNTSEIELEYQRINVEATRNLASQAARAGLSHFVLISSLHAVAANADTLIDGTTVPQPVSAYGRSKLAAEQAIQQELGGSACVWTILRPPLVYGPGNQANFGLLLKLVKSGLPLPLASVRNRRSFIYVENLVDLIVTCLGNPKAFGRIYLPSDGEDVSTPELIRKIAKANESIQCSVFSDSVGVGETSHTVGRRGDPAALRSGSRHYVRLFPFPENLLKLAGRLPGLGALRKLTSSLYVDSEPLRRDLGWTPPFTMDEGLRRTLASRDPVDS
jgi:nucleoside-diphosphate-sugar epimerase